MAVHAVVPAIQEAEAEESLELEGGGCSEPRLCHCTPVWCQRETPSQKKKEIKTRFIRTRIFLGNNFLKSSLKLNVILSWQNQNIYLASWL